MAGLLDGVLPALLSGGNAVRKRVKGLLADPRGFVGELNEDAKTAQDQRHAAFYQDFGRDVGGLLGKSDPAFVQQQAQLGRDQLQNMALNGLTVWHGSPHKFDRFDMSKIGTGEGAQAYGHGLYFAENPAVATDYQNKLAKLEPTMTATFQGQISDKAKTFAENVLKKHGGDVQAASSDLAANAKLMTSKEAKAAAKEAIDALKGAKVEWANDYPIGNLYKVDLPDEAIAKMLDWDKPLSDQPEVAQQAINWLWDVDPNRASKMATYDRYLAMSSTIDNFKSLPPRLKGKQLYEALAHIAGGQKWAGGSAAASSDLANAGVPGIRYLDGGSRGAGQGTRNFVVFDDQLPKILEVNGGLLGR